MSAVLTLLYLLLQVSVPPQAHAIFHGYTEDAPLSAWALATFENLPPYFWNKIFQKQSAEQGAPFIAFGGTFTPCASGWNRGYQGVSCDLTNQYVTSIDLSFASLPPGAPPLLGSLYIPHQAPAIVSLPYLNELNLKGNRLHGSIPMQLGLSPSLKRLILAGNNFSGAIPTQLCDLNLTCLDLSNNSLGGRIPKCFQHFPCADFEGNKALIREPNDCNSNISVSSCVYVPQVFLAPPPSSSGALSLGAIMGIVIGSLAVLAIVLAAFVLFLRYWRRRVHKLKLQELEKDVESQISSRHFGSLVRFREDELTRASNNWSEDCILGEGGYGVVYRGRTDQGTEVAIKKFKRIAEGSEMQFLNEVELLSRAAHKNLVQCLGFCIDTGRCLALVQHYYPNGTVASRTFGKEGAPLSWEDRQRIAKGAADGVAYLHTDCNPKIIHRDIKAANILLTEVNEAAIADFGLAAELHEDLSHKSTKVKGTHGHIAPEYIATGQCTEKTDVYSFGAFLLELVLGKPLSELTARADAAGQLQVNEWMAECLGSDSWIQLVDEDLTLPQEGSTLHEEVRDMLDLALSCMKPEPQERPDMSQVATLLVPKEQHDQTLVKWQKAQFLYPVREESETAPIDVLQWELDNTSLGSDTIGSSLLDSSYFGNSTYGTQKS